MIRQLTLLSGLLAYSLSLLAQAPGPADTALLWRVTSPDTEEASYVYGTIHLIPADDYFLDNEVVLAMNDVSEVYFEIDPGDMQDMSMVMSLMSRINMRGDTSLEDLLDGEKYKAVEDYFGELGLPFFMFKRMKPLFLSAMVGQGEGGGMSMNPMSPDGSTKSYEFELNELAEAGGKEIGGLETMEYQLGLFDSIPYTAQAEMLYDAIVSDSGKEEGALNQYEQMIDMYKRRAIDEMSRMIGEETAGSEDFEQLLVIRRNENWIPIIAGRMADKPTLYAVGAGHLGGPRGVIALLREAGMTVEAVR